MEDQPLRKVMAEIEKKSKYVFFYYDNHVDVNRKVNIHVTDQSISTVLDSLFVNTENNYVISNRQIFITKKEIPINQSFLIEGIILDENEVTLSGAVIYIKDKRNSGVITDYDGKFRINVSKGDILVASFVGFENAEFIITGKDKKIQIQLAENVQELNEVIVVGFGHQRKISSLAAVSTVDVKELQTPTTSISNLLGGKVPGIISLLTSGEPGQNISEFWIRGIGTFGASSGALVLIDGLEGDINSIDPADIEHFSVLKDASATAVYGVRGANGVILISTKKGFTGKAQFTARSNVTLSHLSKMPEYLGGYDYAKMVNEALSVRNGRPLYNNIELSLIKDHLDQDLYPNINWQKEIINKNSFSHSHYLSVRGGNEVARYFWSMGLNQQSAAYKYDKKSIYSSNVGYNTYRYRGNLDLSLTKTTNIYFGTDGFLSLRNEPGIANTDYIWHAQSQINPLLLPIVYSNGQLPAAGEDDLLSPYVMINHTGKTSRQIYKGKATLAINQDFSYLIDGLKMKIQGAYDLNSYFTERRFIQPALYIAQGRTHEGVLITKQTVDERPADYSKATEQYRRYHLESNLSYEKIILQKHRMTGLIYYYISDQKSTDQAVSSVDAIPIRYQGVSGRITYGYKDTYMVDVNFGYTGSENFKPGRQYGFFPSIAAGWVPTNYDIIKKRLPWLNFFKIRASCGLVGNDRITSVKFPYQTKVGIGTGDIWGSATDTEIVIESVMGADNLEWEKAIKTDIGFEGRLFKEQFSFVIDLFNDQRNGIFQQRVQIPDYVGVVTLPYANVGKMRSYGADGNAAFVKKITKNISFAIRGNFTYSRNIVQNWEQAYQKYPYLEYSGYPVYSARGYQTLGLFKDEDDIKYSPAQDFGTVLPGDIKYKDVNGDGKINEEDKVPLSYNTFPRLMYGIGGEFRYKNITLGIMFKGTGKTDFYYVGYGQGDATNGMGYIPFYEGQYGNVLSIAGDPKNRWIPLKYAMENGIDPALAENPDARFPRLQYGYNNNNAQLSDFWKGDARYFRLQEITLNYNLNHSTLNKIGIKSIDLQFVANNVYVWDKVDLWDPEQAQYNGRKYPIPSTYTLQIYLNF
ncbi:MAG: TonB-dependent receptor [Bacteroidales bacterium]|jgi:TonB-linked SusC/RagA family outer membrane protein|nr:TonB-dependent receptor [Bacteroidales bacterium]